ncbi:MAG: DUF418 domain-containing protein [Sphingopyxis sp.]
MHIPPNADGASPAAIMADSHGPAGAGAPAELAGPAARARINGLDVTRGFAVMGILTMNIIGFAMPQSAYFSPVPWGSAGAADVAAWAAAFILFDSKMRGLFTLLFGASALLVMQSAAQSGRSTARVHYTRMGTLALFGLAHYALLWWGDILLLYAVCGLFLYPFRNAGPRALAIAGTAMITLNTLMIGLGLWAMRMTAATGDVDALEGVAAMNESFTHNTAEAIQEFALMNGSYAAIIHDRVVANGTSALWGVVEWGFETLGLMLIGMALFKMGMLAGEWTQERLARWRNIGLISGAVGAAILVWWQWQSGYEGLTIMLASLALSVPFDTAMAIGYAALFMGLAHRFGGSAAMVRVAAAGRAAFTNYLGTSLVMTTIFYGYGLGLFGSVDRAPLYLFVGGAWVIMLLWSKPWLDRFAYGPMEWLWRSMARGRWQPLARRPVG